MREITTELKIDKSGRIVIPEVYREELDVKPGQLIKITISNPLEKILKAGIDPRLAWSVKTQCQKSIHLFRIIALPITQLAI